MRSKASSPLMVCTGFFVLGSLLGVLATGSLDPMEKGELLSYVEVFLRSLDNPGVDSATVLKAALLQNARTGLLVWALGLTIIGVPIACALVFVRGFALSFSAGFLVSEWGRGPLLVLSGMVPHNLLAVPALILMVSYAVSFSLALVRDRTYMSSGQLWNRVFAYTASWFRIFLVFLLSGVLEAYLSPFLMRLAS